MNIWSVLVLAVSSNLDDLGVGFSIGMKRKISLGIIGIIAGMSALTMGTGLLLGEEIAGFLPEPALAAV